MRKGGLEPPRYCYRQPLKLVRLPIPPLPQVVFASFRLRNSSQHDPLDDSLFYNQNVAKRQQKTELIERLLSDGKLRLERRNGSPHLTACAFVQGRNKSKSTRTGSLPDARDRALQWYFGLCQRVERGEHIHGRTFAACALAFLEHADSIGEVSEGQRRNYRQKWELLAGYFQGVRITDVDAKFLMKLRQDRASGPPPNSSFAPTSGDKKPRPWKRPSNATLKKDLDFVRLVLHHAVQWLKCITAIPQFPSFRGRNWKVVSNPRPFLNYEQWKRVRQRARDRGFEEGQNPRSQRQRQELYCFLMICVGAALRVEEAYSLRWADCQPITLDDRDRTEAIHLRVFGKHSELTGKREDGYAIYDGVIGYNTLKSLRPDAKPDDALFEEKHRDGMRRLLIDCGLRELVEGINRDSKSLRQTGISMRLDLGPSPDYRDIAKWARTSVREIGRFYDQSHPKDSVGRVVGFRKTEKLRPKNAAERKRLKASAAALAKLQRKARAEQERIDRDRDGL